jgi:hypothetical protein
MGRLLALFAALIAAGLIAWSGELTPKPQPATAAATTFSAERAMADIVGMASVPHPVGSAADAASRDFLVARMTALGLGPQVHPGVGIYQPKRAPDVIALGNVENIVGVLPGRDRSAPAVALMAHYDSVPGSTGASDDAAGASSALEIVRALKAKGVPARDVIVLLTDGEEAGLLGASAFFRDDPMAKRVGFLFNMEARGSSGRVQMFQTGDGNGDAIRMMAAKAPRATASSLTGFIYKYMPNDTDFTVSKAAGVPGLNYAFIGHQFDYHAASSTPATQDRGTLQDMGDQVLATAQAVAFAPALPAKTPDLVYSQTPGGLTLFYSPMTGWLIVAGAAALLAWAVARARKAQAFPWLDLARGAGGLLFAVLSGAVVLHLARKATGAAVGYFEQRVLLAQAPLWETAVLLLGAGVVLWAVAHMARGRRTAAIVPLLAGLATCLFGSLDKIGLGEGVIAALIGLAIFGRPTSRPGGWAGALLLGLFLAAVAQALAPPAAFIFAWPVAWAALAAATTAAGAHRGRGALVVLALFAAMGLAFAASFAHASFLSLDLMELQVLPLIIVALSAWPLAQTEEGAPPARLLGPVLVLIGLVITVAVRFNHPYDARHPDLTDVTYDIDQTAHKAWRMSYAPQLNAWSRAVLTTGGAKVGKRPAGRGNLPTDAAPAPYIELPAPEITSTPDTTGQLILHVAPPPGARLIDLKFRPNTAATIVAAGGVPIRFPLKPGADSLLRWSAAQKGFDVVIRPGGPGKLSVGYSAIIEQWPAAAPPLPPRPRDVMAFDTSDSTEVEGSRTFSW